MTVPYLTKPAGTAHKPRMMGTRRAVAGAIVVLGSAMAGGCISVKAPNEPIVIELNVNIRQEVIYRLADDAGNTIDENKDIF